MKENHQEKIVGHAKKNQEQVEGNDAPREWRGRGGTS